MPPWKPALLNLLHALWEHAEPFVPGALGALVAQMMRPGLGIRQRFIQWTVSVIVFHFVSLAVATLFVWPKSVADVVGFFVAFLAFEALHAWQKALVEAGVDTIKGIPGFVRDMAASWGRRPGAAVDPAPPASSEGEG